MPTNVLRQQQRPPAPEPRAPSAALRVAVLTAGRVSIRIVLAATETADRVWRALPLHSTAETWGRSVHFEVPVDTGRDRTARLNGVIGDIYFWVEDDRILVPFGPTPVSARDGCRLPRPCNVWATALDDVRALHAVQSGEKISLVAEPSAYGS